MAETDRAPLDIEVRRLGRVRYDRAVELQEALIARRRDGVIPDQLLFLEHPHVITMGSGAKVEHVLADAATRERMGVALVRSGRGGDVTYHGPGQLIGYPILDLKPDRQDLHQYLRDLEEVLLRVVSGYGVEGRRTEGRTGVWTEEGKVAAIGIRVSSGWITSHGFALNVAPDLSFFRAIVPCGLADQRVTSLEHLLGRAVSIDNVMDRTSVAFGDVFGRTVRAASESIPPEFVR